MDIIWTDYLKYRARLRNFDLAIIEEIVKHSSERYFDSTTDRPVVVGRHGNNLVMIPYERQGEIGIPITVHVTTRQQINFRLKTGRFQHE